MIPPVPVERLQQLADEICLSTIGSADAYDHGQTQTWNNTIINTMLKAVVAEATPKDATAPAFKFACNSTIVQHSAPPPPGKAITRGVQGTAPVSNGRRGMHSAMGAYWDSEKDGIWTYKYDGESKGMDVVIMLIWVG